MVYHTQKQQATYRKVANNSSRLSSSHPIAIKCIGRVVYFYNRSKVVRPTVRDSTLGLGCDFFYASILL